MGETAEISEEERRHLKKSAKMHVRLAHLEHGEVGGLFAGQPVQGQGGQLTQVALTTV